MRILHVSEVAWGGVVKLIEQFTHQQVQRGADVFLLAPPDFPTIDVATTYRWDYVRRQPWSYPRAYLQLRRTVAEVRPDVIHLHSFMAGFLGRLPGAVDGVPVVYQPHAWSFDLLAQKTFRDSLETWERWSGRRTALMVTNCQEEIAEGRAVGVTTEGISIGVAIDANHFTPVDEATRQRAREELGVEKRMLLCIGRLTRQKGQDLLLEAWERRPIPDTELVLVGPGDTAPLRAIAPTQWGKSIRAVGEHADVRPWLAACDALVLSSRYETVALVVAEAMASCRPVVATAVNGTGEVLVGGHLPDAGIVVPTGDMDALLDAAVKILDEPDLSQEMSTAGRRRAEELFSPAAVADRLQAAYLQAIAEAREGDVVSAMSERDRRQQSLEPAGRGRLRGTNVLFISVSFSPEHTGIGPYAGASAQALADEDADVSVLTGLPHYPAWRVTPSDRWRLRRNEIRAGARVARLRQVVPRRHTALSRFLYEFTFLLHGLLTRKSWPRPDVVVAVSPSLSGALLARRFARQHGVPMIVIVQDLVALGAEQSGIRGGSLIASLLGRTEARVLLSADLVGLAHGTFANACIRMGIEPERIRVVPNWSLRELPRDVQAADIPDWKDRFVVLHAGNMGFKQGLEVVVDAARLAEDRGENDLLFVLMGDGNRRDALERSAHGISTLTITDPAPEAEFPGILAAADVLLVTQRPEVVDMSVASKLTTYFTAGRPVVCSATATGGTATEVLRAKAGRVVPPGEAGALLDAVLDLRESPEEASALGESGQAYAQDHLSASAGLDRVVELIASAVVPRASR